MAHGFVANSTYLKGLLKEIGDLRNSLNSQSFIGSLSDWSGVPYGESDWSSSATSSGITSAGYTLLPGSPANFVPAKQVMSAGTAFAGSVMQSLNWLDKVLDDAATNITDMLKQISSTEADNGVAASALTSALTGTIGDLTGGSKTA